MSKIAQQYIKTHVKCCRASPAVFLQKRYKLCGLLFTNTLKITNINILEEKKRTKDINKLQLICNRRRFISHQFSVSQK